MVEKLLARAFISLFWLEDACIIFLRPPCRNYQVCSRHSSIKKYLHVVSFYLCGKLVVSLIICAITSTTYYKLTTPLTHAFIHVCSKLQVSFCCKFLKPGKNWRALSAVNFYFSIFFKSIMFQDLQLVFNNGPQQRLSAYATTFDWILPHKIDITNQRAKLKRGCSSKTIGISSYCLGNDSEIDSFCYRAAYLLRLSY